MARVATAFKSRGLSLDAKFFIFALVLFWVGLIVLYPILLLIVDSFKIGDGVFRPREGWGIGNWVSAYTNPGLLRALGNTVFVVIIVQAISVPIGVGVAWLLARSDLPGKEWIDLAMWVAFFLPTLPIVLGYVLLLAPEFGLANKAWTTVFGGVSGPFNIYSVAGIIWMHLVTKTIVVKAILLRPIFANMDASLEESARICGTNTPFTIVRIVVPLMMPAVATVTMLGVLFGLESFEIERVLGPPIQFPQLRYVHLPRGSQAAAGIRQRDSARRLGPAPDGAYHLASAVELPAPALHDYHRSIQAAAVHPRARQVAGLRHRLLPGQPDDSRSRRFYAGGFHS